MINKDASLESESIGVAVIGSLQDQRVKLVSAKEKVILFLFIIVQTENIDTNLTKAQRVLRNMGQRALTDTCIQYIIIVFLVLCVCFYLFIMLQIGGIVFYKWIWPMINWYVKWQ